VCCADLFIDDLIRIAFIWSLTKVHDEAIKDTIVVSIGLDPELMVQYGYIGCFVMMTVVHEVAQNAVAKIKHDRDGYKVTVERIYVAVSAVAGIMVWDGMYTPRCFCNTVYIGLRCIHHSCSVPSDDQNLYKVPELFPQTYSSTKFHNAHATTIGRDVVTKLAIA